MSRRKSDKDQRRLLILVLIFNAALSVLSAVIGGKAIWALDKFGALMDDTRKVTRKSLAPEGY